MSSTQIGKGGGGGHGGHGGHGHGHGHHHGGGRGWRGGGWYGGPWVYDVVPYSTGIEITDLLEAAEDDKDRKEQTKELASEIVKQIKGGKATVGEDLDLLDADLLGEDKGKDAASSVLNAINPATWLQTAGSLFQSGLNIYDKEEANKKAEAEKTKSAADEQRKLQAAITADVVASQSIAVAARSAAQKLPSAAVDASAATQAQATQQRAGAGLSPESTDKRIEAAQRALTAATSAAQRDPTNVYTKALMDAWAQTMNKIQNAQISAGSPASDGGGRSGGKSASWWEGRTGPVSNKAIAGAGGVAALGLLAKKFLTK